MWICHSNTEHLQNLTACAISLLVQWGFLPHLPSHKNVGGFLWLAWNQLLADIFLYFSTQGDEWVGGWENTESQAEWRVCTDLFLLNSSRFNQQIIDLIKWHPLLGQEPARSMRISQAKKKKKRAYTHTPNTPTFSHSQCHQTLHCLLQGCWNK